MAASVLNRLTTSRIIAGQLTSASLRFHHYRVRSAAFPLKGGFPPRLQAHGAARPGLQRLPGPGPGLRLRPPAPAALCSSAASGQEPVALATQTLDRYKQRPWEYMDSEEYAERYGSGAVWAGYRRNHRGGIPPQQTRKTCIRGDKVCGNPCPICRDPNIIVHHQNVKLLQQFISPHSGMLHDPSLTGVCVKQQKELQRATDKARDDGLLPFQIPHVEFRVEEYSNAHAAVGVTAPPPSQSNWYNWYHWYGEMRPDGKKVDQVKKTYKAYLKR